MKNRPVAPPESSAPPVGDEPAVRCDAVAVALGLVVVSCAVIYALLNAGVPLRLQALPLVAKVMPHAGIGSTFVFPIGLAGGLCAVRISTSLRWRRLGPLAAVTAIGWTSSLALVDGWQRGGVGRLSTDDEYPHDLPRIGGVAGFLQDSPATSPICNPAPGPLTLVVDVTGLSKAETERIWLPF